VYDDMLESQIEIVKQLDNFVGWCKDRHIDHLCEEFWYSLGDKNFPFVVSTTFSSHKPFVIDLRWIIKYAIDCDRESGKLEKSARPEGLFGVALLPPNSCKGLDDQVILQLGIIIANGVKYFNDGELEFQAACFNLISGSDLDPVKLACSFSFFCGGWSGLDVKYFSETREYAGEFWYGPSDSTFVAMVNVVYGTIVMSFLEGRVTFEDFVEHGKELSELLAGHRAFLLILVGVLINVSKKCNIVIEGFDYDGFTTDGWKAVRSLSYQVFDEYLLFLQLELHNIAEEFDEQDDQFEFAEELKVCDCMVRLMHQLNGVELKIKNKFDEDNKAGISWNADEWKNKVREVLFKDEMLLSVRHQVKEELKRRPTKRERE